MHWMRPVHGASGLSRVRSWMPEREKTKKKKSGWEVWGSAVGAPLQPKLFSKAKAARPLFSLASLHDPHWQKTHRRRGGTKKDINTELRGQQYSEMKKRWVAWEWIGSKPPKSQTEGRAAGKRTQKNTNFYWFVIEHCTAFISSSLSSVVIPVVSGSCCYGFL